MIAKHRALLGNNDSKNTRLLESSSLSHTDPLTPIVLCVVLEFCLIINEWLLVLMAFNFFYWY